MEIYKKINQAIDKIKKSDLKKAGKNKFSNYDYYTPEQVDKLVHDACKELNLFIRFDLVRNEFGIVGNLGIIDLDDDSDINRANFTMATEIPEIKATNAAQQIGGTMTYTKRYMLMNVFNIVDNNLDFDTTENTKNANVANIENHDKKWLNRFLKDGKTIREDYVTIVNKAKEKGFTIKDLREYYAISKNVESYLINDLKNGL